jgi:hypothetical protein
MRNQDLYLIVQHSGTHKLKMNESSSRERNIPVSPYEKSDGRGGESKAVTSVTEVWGGDLKLNERNNFFCDVRKYRQ